MSLYNLRTLNSLDPTTYMIAKFDDDFNVVATYTLSPSRNGHYTCDCPAGSRSVVTKPCRHRLMLPTLLPAVDTDRFYDHDTRKFCEPLGDLLRPTADLAGQEALPNMTATEIDEAFKKAHSGPDHVQEAAWSAIAPLVEQMHNLVVGEALRIEPSVIGGTVTSVLVTSDLPASAPAIRRR